MGAGASQYGTGGDPDRKAITTRIDHNINNEHRVSGTFNLENFYVTDGYRVWPEDYGGYSGSITRKPWSLAINLNSTLTPTILNEFRFGYSRSDTWVYKPLNAADADSMSNVLLALAGNDASNPFYAGSWLQDQMFIFGPGEGDGGAPNSTGALNAAAYRSDNAIVFGVTDNIDRSYPYGTRGSLMATWGGHDPRLTFSDTVTWIKGSHSFKAGADYRRQSSFQSTDGTTSVGVGGANTNLPVSRGGVTTGTANRRRQSLANARAAGRGWEHIYAASQDTASTIHGSYVLPYNMMSLFSGSMADTGLMFYAIPDTNSSTGARWNDLAAGESAYAYTIRNQEFSWFFKDDWKVTSDLTLNLGIRWEYYGVPHASDGMTLNVHGDSNVAWGISDPGDFYNNGKSWVVDRTYLPGFQRDTAGNPILPEPVIKYEFIGPDSPNPDRMAWNRDLNNFAPHVGFAWSLPWFGKGLTTLRGGYSVSYSAIDSFNGFPGQIVNIPAAGVSYTRRFYGDGSNTNPADTAYYMDITDLKNLLPLKPAGNVFPLGVQLNDAIYASGATVIDENLQNPYVHSLNMSLTRSIGRMFTVDVRYVGTFRRNSITSMNVNQNPFLDTTLFNWIDELDKVRAGEESMYINSIIPHNGPQGSQRYYGTGYDATGSAQLSQRQAGNLAFGAYNSIVSALGTENGQLPTFFGSERGMLLRSGCMPQDRPGYTAAFAANPLVNVLDFPCTVGLPLNFYYRAPQYASSSIRHNTDSVNNYNSMQAQVTMRPTYGLNFQATYTWSRNLGNSSWTNYLGERDYLLSDQHRSHMLRVFGTWELPFGQRGLLLRNASSAVRKAAEGWKMSWVLGMESGPPLSVTASGAGSTLYGRSWPILVRSDLWDDKQGKVRMEWGPDGEFLPGTYLAGDYIKVLDTNLCNPDRMSQALYTTQCASVNPTTGAVTALSQAPRALALATTNAEGRSVPAVYDRDHLGDDGVMYKAGDPIIVFRNADQSDGRNATGNYKPGRMTAQGRFSFDMAMSKEIEFMEGKRFEIRIDAQNILNHATAIGPIAPGNMDGGGKYVSIDAPTLAITGSGNIGTLSNKGGHRTFQARLALRF